MKLAFVFAPSSPPRTSVYRKITNQILAMRELGVEAKGFFFSHQKDLGDNEVIKHIYVHKKYSGLFASIKNKLSVHQELLNYFSADEFKDFSFYVRYTGSGSAMDEWAIKFEKRYLVEHITKELEELALYQPEKGVGRLSQLLGRLEFFWIPRYLESRYGSLIRMNAIAGICNSEDIAIYQSLKAKGSYHTVISGDAVNPEDYSVLPPNKLDHQLNMIFLKGSSSGYDYNGIDRVINGIVSYNGPYAINFEIYGKHLEIERALVEKHQLQGKVRLGGFLDKDQQREVFRRMHLGVSALAVHRKGLNSTTTIKSREYSAMGLPFIYAYEDPDFGTSTAEFALKLDRSDAPIDLVQIIEWRKTLNNKMNAVGQRMRTFAEEHLSYQSKMLKIKNLIKDS